MSGTKTSSYASYNGGPVGYGDPDSTYISDLERGNLVSKFVQEKFLTELCADQWAQWRNCIRSKQNEWFTALKCKHCMSVVHECQNKYLMNPDEVKKLEAEYLKLRSDFRRTGVGFQFMTKEKLRQITSQ